MDYICLLQVWKYESQLESSRAMKVAEPELASCFDSRETHNLFNSNSMMITKGTHKRSLGPIKGMQPILILKLTYFSLNGD